jgi:hypothetical protein
VDGAAAELVVTGRDEVYRVPAGGERLSELDVVVQEATMGRSFDDGDPHPVRMIRLVVGSVLDEPGAARRRDPASALGSE